MKDKDLDKWIAENVMGWVIYVAPGIQHPDFEWYGNEHGPTPSDLKTKDWQPTESISDAFQVVEKMMERFPDGFCTIDTFGENYNKQDKGKGHCVVTFQESAEGYIIYSCEQAETASLAICLAAKRAVEEME